MQVKFEAKSNTGFHKAVRANVDAYFKQNSISKNANTAMVLKTILFLGLYVGLYLLIMSNQFSLLEMLGLAILHGMVQAFIGFNVSHDAIHGSYSANPTINKIIGHSFYLLGANVYVWSITHNHVHHTYTNIPGHDEDLDVAPGMLCLSPNEELKPIMRYQHFYAFFLYSLSSLSWVLRKDYKKIFQDKIGQTDNTKHPKIEYFNLFFFKALYYLAFIVAPLVVLDITWWQFIIGFLALHFAEGLVLGLVFQLAHVVEQTEFPEPDENNKMDDTWAVLQMKTTADFARDSWLVNFLCGGLNFQIEHHLFPLVCHIHYPEVSKIVKQTALEHNVPFHENKTFVSALQSHYRCLKKFGSGQLTAA